MNIKMCVNFYETVLFFKLSSLNEFYVVSFQRTRIKYLLGAFSTNVKKYRFEKRKILIVNLLTEREN